jgi:hypothetical protein
MLEIVRRIAIALVVVGSFSTVHFQPTLPTSVSSTLSAGIPVPVCPPNDPGACHIDQW